MLPPLPLPGAFSRGRGGSALAGTGYELWVLAGQSNMVAFAQNSPVTSFPSGVLQVSRNGALSGSTVDNQLIPAVHPLDSVNAALSGTPYNLADKFAVDWQADATNSGKTLVLLPCAEGATSIANGATWSADPSAGTRLADMVSRINTFFTNYPGATMGGFLWHQGESTADFGYGRLFEKMRAYVIANCARVTGSTPWVVGGSVGGPPYGTSFLAQSFFGSTIPYARFADSTGTTDVGDGVHFNKASLDIMGEVYHDESVLAAANDSVDLGLDQPYGFHDFASGTYTQQRATVTDITDGKNFLFPSGQTLVRRGWKVMAANTLVNYTWYRVSFNILRDDNTDTINMGIGTTANMNNVGGINIAATAGVETPFTFEFNTLGNASAAGGLFIGMYSTGPTATNVELTDFVLRRTISE